ncbi:MAG: threonine/serine dehydratase [Chloroflexota bacterium]
MAERLVSLGQIHAARERIAGRINRTPMLSSATAARRVASSSQVRLRDDRLYVKAEHLQKTGSFKPRAALARLTSLTAEERAAGAITLSAGNAAQAYAWAGSIEGVKMTVTMPAGAVRSKVDACREYGAEVVLHGQHVGETLARLQELVAERGLTFVHPFDDPEVIAGNGTTGLEILEDLPDVDVVVVGVGGGGCISGIATALKESRSGVRVYGVEPAGSEAVSLAMKAGHVVRIDPVSVADGLGAPFAGEWTLPICQRYLDDIIVIDDAMILRGLRFAAERMKQVLEPAGAAALTAVIHGRIPIRDGERVCVVASGGNVEISRLGEFIGAAV